MDDLYAILGVTRTATHDQIRDAYRRNARRLHPDVNPDPWAAERFKEMTGAYEVLRDENKRASYDLTLPQVHVFADETDHTGNMRHRSESAVTEFDHDQFITMARAVVVSLRADQQVQLSGSVRERTYAAAVSIFEKSLHDYEAAYENPLFEARFPAVIQVAERFLQEMNPNDVISNERSSKHLINGILGIVGLARVAQVAGHDASPRAKEATARAIMAILANALLKAGLVHVKSVTAAHMIDHAAYRKAELHALAELESAVRNED